LPHPYFLKWHTQACFALLTSYTIWHVLHL
jgi:hypothetical protein